MKVKWNGVWWCRIGQCRKCGKCCACGVHHYRGVEKKSGGWDWSSVKFIGYDKGMCTLFNQKTYKCKGYERRPDICRAWPFNPGIPLPEGCGYGWQKTSG